MITVLAGWLVLSLPAGILIGKCIKYGQDGDRRRQGGG